MNLSILKTKLFKSAGIYTIVNFINKAFPFILLPIFARELSLDDFGKYSIFKTTLSFLIPVTGLSFSEFIVRKYFENLNKNYLSTVLIQIVFNAGLFLAIIFLFPKVFKDFVGLESKFIAAGLLVAFSTNINNIHRGLLRCANNNSLFGFLVLAQSFIYFSIIVIGYLFLNLSLSYIVQTEVIVFLFFSMISLIYLIRQYGFSFNVDQSVLNEGWKYSFPLFLNSLLIYSFTLFDRYIINFKLEPSDVALYVGVFQFSSILQVLGSSFNGAWSPWVFDYLSKKPNKKHFLKYSLFLTIFFIVVSICFAFLAFFSLEIFLGKKYISGKMLIFGFVGAIFSQIVYWIFAPIIHFYKKNWILTYPIIPILLINIILNFIYLPIYGIIFSSILYFFSWFILAVITVLHSLKFASDTKDVQVI